MPPDAAEDPQNHVVTGRCYCGSTLLTSRTPSQLVPYCHCSDCRRLTGAPAAAFAAFSEDAVSIRPARPLVTPADAGVRRSFCSDSGSPLAAWFDYLPGQVYVPLGLLDKASDFPAQMHSHVDAKLPWLEIADDAKRGEGSSRAGLVAAFDKG